MADRASAGAQGFNLDHGHRHQVAVMPVPARIRRSLTAHHDGDVVAGSSHVDTEKIFLRLGGAHPGSADHPTGRARGQDPDGHIPEVFPGHHAPARLHDEQVPGVPRARKALDQPIEIPAHPRADEGVHHGGARSLEFRGPGQNPVGERDRHAGQDFLDEFPQPLFMDRVHEREEQ